MLKLVFGTILALVPGTALSAVPLVLTYDSYNESKTLIGAFAPGEAIRLDGALPDRGGGSLSQILNFTSGSTALSLSATWRLAPTDNRVVGVNIDLFDRSSNALVASDSFLGVFGDLARSEFVTSGLTVGRDYALVFTGTAVEGGRYRVDLEADATPPPAPAADLVPTSPALSVFDTLQGTKNYGAFAAGNELLIDGIISESGSILDVSTIAFAGGNLSAGIAWLVAPGEFRTVGVNFDVFDSSNALVGSDSFMGVTDGQAFSQFALNGLNPGTYRLVFTGTATQSGRYRIDLGTDAVAPGFVPIPTGVPEPATWALMLTGFGMTGYALRRRPTLCCVAQA